MQFTPFAQQEDFLKAALFGDERPRAMGAFAGKRGGKTEVGAVTIGSLIEQKFAWDKDSIDPYVAVVCAPTYDMLRRLSWKKFSSYWKPFFHKKFKGTKTPLEVYWHDHVPDSGSSETIIYGISAEKPERIEGIKASVIWIDEVFQVTEQFFLECLARTADCGGVVILTGSLGVQFVNPKEHWVYKYFKKEQLDGFLCIEWASADNPHLSKKEIARLAKILDRKTFEAMFTITWDLVPKSAVYEDFSDANILDSYTFNPNLPLHISIDWGWTHPMAVGFYQYDKSKDHIYKFDEIVKSKMTLDQLYQEIIKRPFIKTTDNTRQEKAPDGSMVTVKYKKITNVAEWICDIAGDQEREQTALSNVAHFRSKYGILFKKRKSAILKGIALLRSFVKSATGEVRFFVTKNCTETISGFKRYAFPEKDGQIMSELPVKKDDDAMDETRYYVWNMHDRTLMAGIKIS